MYRRRYLAATAAALIAGCSGTGGDDASPTDGPSTTSSPTATDGQTGAPVAETTETETSDAETETADTETPDAEERAANALAEARSALGRAHGAYLDQADGASTLAEVSAATTGFDPAPVTDEIETARSHLDAASEDAEDEQAGQVDDLREATAWLGALAQFQAATSTVVDHLERVVDRADFDEAAEFDDYDGVVEELEAAEDALPAVSQAQSAVGDVDSDAFSSVEGVDPDAVEATDDGLVALSLAFTELDDPLATIRGETRRIEDARAAIEADDEDDAETAADRAARRLRGALRSVTDRRNPDEFAPVVDVVERVVDELVALAEETEADAEEA